MGWAKWSYRSCAEWLAWRCGLTLSAAREKVRTAQALRGLPAISAAFADGRLSYSKVRALTRCARAHDEDLLLAYALEATAAQVEERCRQIRNVAPESVDIARRAWERRSLSVWRNSARGTMTITVEVPIEEGEVVTRALDRAVEAGEAASGPEFASGRESAENGWRAQQADALIAVAKAYLTAGAGAEAGPARGSAAVSAASAATASVSAADRYQVVMHVDERALRGGAASRAGAPRSDLPIETVKRLTCDGSLITVVEDDRGTPLDIGRKQRTVSTALKRALWSRDRGCSFPGCQRTHYVDAHHIRHWAEGGDTSLENLTLLCSHHHRLSHEGGFHIRRDREGAIYFQRPDGRVIPRHGYRLEDVLDDSAGHAEAGPDVAATHNESPAARLAAIVHGRGPSAEVRESRGVFRIGTIPLKTARAARRARTVPISPASSRIRRQQEAGRNNPFGAETRVCRFLQEHGLVPTKSSARSAPAAWARSIARPIPISSATSRSRCCRSRSSKMQTVSPGFNVRPKYSRRSITRTLRKSTGSSAVKVRRHSSWSSSTGQRSPIASRKAHSRPTKRSTSRCRSRLRSKPRTGGRSSIGT
jgi:hypothetical protein